MMKSTWIIAIDIVDINLETRIPDNILSEFDKRHILDRRYSQFNRLLTNNQSYLIINQDYYFLNFCLRRVTTYNLVSANVSDENTTSQNSRREHNKSINLSVSARNIWRQFCCSEFVSAINQYNNQLCNIGLRGFRWSVPRPGAGYFPGVVNTNIRPSSTQNPLCVAKSHILQEVTLFVQNTAE
jgi:hypothetical protein